MCRGGRSNWSRRWSSWAGSRIFCSRIRMTWPTLRVTRSTSVRASRFMRRIAARPLMPIILDGRDPIKIYDISSLSLCRDTQREASFTSGATVVSSQATVSLGASSTTTLTRFVISAGTPGRSKRSRWPSAAKVMSASDTEAVGHLFASRMHRSASALRFSMSGIGGRCHRGRVPTS
jgi:hypothetical protein